MVEELTTSQFSCDDVTPYQTTRRAEKHASFVDAFTEEGDTDAETAVEDAIVEAAEPA